MKDLVDRSDAFIAARLPGTEGAGMTDLLVAPAAGEPSWSGFTGRLPFPWPLPIQLAPKQTLVTPRRWPEWKRSPDEYQSSARAARSATHLPTLTRSDDAVDNAGRAPGIHWRTTPREVFNRD